jgi:signal transduction histidine kinase
LHSISYALLYWALDADSRELSTLLLMLVVLFWVSYAGNALALLLKRIGDYLGELNSQLEERIAERTRELEEAQAHLLHQEKMAAFGLLAAGIAHEVGNPLTSISSLVQMLQRRDCDGYTREKLTHVNGQLQRIQNTLRELVNFSRPTTSEKTWVGIGEIVEEALNIAKYYKRVKGRHIEAHVSPDLPPIYGCRDQLVQVLLNLVLNAIDATDKGGHISIEAMPANDAVVVKVRDDGCGVAPEHRQRLFEPYFTTKKHGTGLGLCVTRKLIHEHGGSVQWDSQPGQGTEFQILLPQSRV